MSTATNNVDCIPTLLPLGYKSNISCDRTRSLNFGIQDDDDTVPLTHTITYIQNI